MKGISLTLIIFLIASCSPIKEEQVPLWINKLMINESGRTDSLFKYSSTYIELKLTSVTKPTEKFYIASYELEPFSIKNRVLELQVTDSIGVMKRFLTPNDFINYIDGRGYQLVTENKNKYGGNYTFKRK